MNIYVGNLPRTVSEDALRQAFQQFGEVTKIKLIKDKFTNELKGFGFVEMPVQSEAAEAIAQMNGKNFEGQRLRVNEAREPEARPRTGGGNRFGGDRSGGSRGGNGGGFRSNRY